MISDIRKAYNDSFSTARYEAFLNDISTRYDHKPPFRIAETPVFIGSDMRDKIIKACDEICDVLCRDDFKARSADALRPEYTVPNEPDHNVFLQLDFGLCADHEGNLQPKLIELQGFPTLYYYQDLVANLYRKHFEIPDHVSHLFNNYSGADYRALLRRVILGSSAPENCILLEVEPHKQPTQIDFWATREILGLKVLCISDLKKSGRDLYYEDEKGKKIGVDRIYNRVIFDELVGRKDLHREYSFTDEINAHWVGHPNWFFRISKNTLELLDESPYVPRTVRLSQLDRVPDDLENYVLKPLYSFSGSGVIFHVTQKHLEAINNPDNFILQEKVTYSPVIKSPDGDVKCEVRMLMIWEPDQERPHLVNNLARLSRGEMIGVKYNRDMTWVGGSVGFFE